MRGQQHRRAVGHRLPDELPEELARGRIEPGVRLVEQPQRGPAGQQRGQGGPAPLAGREPAGGGGAQAAGQPDPGQGGLGPFGREAEGPHGEPDVLRRGEVVVERGGMSQKTDVTPDGGVVRGEVDPEDAWPRPR